MERVRSIEPDDLSILASACRMVGAMAPDPQRRARAKRLAEWLAAQDSPVHLLGAAPQLPAWLDGGREHAVRPVQWPEIGTGGASSPHA